MCNQFRFGVFVVAIALAFAALTPSVTVAQSAAGQATLSTDQLVVGGTGSITVTGTGYRECAGQPVSVSLLFRRVTNTGYGTFDGALRLSPQDVTLDSTGGFVAKLAEPDTFPGWLGYVAMEGSCIKLAPLRLLTGVSTAVPLGSGIASQMGISQQAGAVLIVPAVQVRTLPIMVDDPAQDPYQKLAPLNVFDASGARCATAGASDRTEAGDLLVVADKCGDGSGLKVAVGSPATLLVSTATVRAGFATPVELVFPAPGTAAPGPEPANTPLAPAAGSGVSGSTAGSRDGGISTTMFALIAILGLATFGAGVGLRRRHSTRG